MKNLVLLVFLLLLGIDVDAQRTSLKGTITDHNGEGINKVEIYVDMLKIKASSNKKGQYKLKHPSEFQIITIYNPDLGFINWNYKGEEEIDFVFPEGSEALKKEDFLALGYSEPVPLTEAEKNSYANYASILDILDNRFQQVQVKNGRILLVSRGVNSALVQDPLILVNEIPTTVSNLGTIPTQEVKSIRVISKASETAVYGIRGADGVILVKLKDGEDG